MTEKKSGGRTVDTAENPELIGKKLESIRTEREKGGPKTNENALGRTRRGKFKDRGMNQVGSAAPAIHKPALQPTEVKGYYYWGKV